MENQVDLLQDDLKNIFKRRRQLLPWWMKVFIWIFLVFGTIVPISVVFGIAGYKFQISLYGFGTNEPLSMIGFLLIFIFLLKGVVAYGLWTEKNWAINLGIADAVLGILICLLTMLIFPLFLSSKEFKIRFELFLLVPYLIKLFRLKNIWSKVNF